MQLKALYLPLLAFIFILSFVDVRPVAALYFPSRLGETLPTTLVNLFQKYCYGTLQISTLDNEDVDPEDFWQRARDLGEKAQSYTENLMKDAAERSQEARQKIAELAERMKTIVGGATALHEELHALSKLRVQRLKRDVVQTETVSLDDIAEDLQHTFAKVLEELQVMFPLPDKALGHEDREVVVTAALEKAGAALLMVCAKYGMDEERARVHWDGTLRPPIHMTVVLIGDLVEQHPDLLTYVLFTGAVMLIPNYWLLRLLLGIFGFGPAGPGKGTTAAWAQRVFYGAAVSKGSWFRFLDSVAMTVKAPGWLGWLGGLIGIGLGSGGVVFGSCGKRK
ncbi:hypothetical protein DFH07DRAFT_967775 [Mycena maculata]|uniref:Uncharacterized protein n=1 Tax=Mycena maculata TaxID=230809 RepID=A0AAD7I370_9AGAR|nr:hypothetical protein DFH07DRAFT_967775 [Mycena maculata]